MSNTLATCNSRCHYRSLCQRSKCCDYTSQSMCGFYTSFLDESSLFSSQSFIYRAEGHLVRDDITIGKKSADSTTSKTTFGLIAYAYKDTSNPKEARRELGIALRWLDRLVLLQQLRPRRPQCGSTSTCRSTSPRARRTYSPRASVARRAFSRSATSTRPCTRARCTGRTSRTPPSTRCISTTCAWTTSRSSP